MFEIPVISSEFKIVLILNFSEVENISLLEFGMVCLDTIHYCFFLGLVQQPNRSPCFYTFLPLIPSLQSSQNVLFLKPQIGYHFLAKTLYWLPMGLELKPQNLDTACTLVNISVSSCATIPQTQPHPPLCSIDPGCL